MTERRVQKWRPQAELEKLVVAAVGPGLSCLNGLQFPPKILGHPLDISLLERQPPASSDCHGVIFIDISGAVLPDSQSIEEGGTESRQRYIDRVRSDKGAPEKSRRLIIRTLELKPESELERCAKMPESIDRVKSAILEECANLSRMIFNDGDPGEEGLLYQNGI